MHHLPRGTIDGNLRLKVTLGIVIPLVLILGTFTLIQDSRNHAILLENLSVVASYNGQIIEDALWRSMLESDFEDVQSTLDSVGKNQNFRVVYILDTSGRVIFMPGKTEAGITLNNQDPACQPCHKLPEPDRPTSVVVKAEDGQRVFRSMQPIENSPACSECHDPGQKLIGLLLTDIYVAPFEAALTSDLRQNLAWWGGTILATAIIVNFMMRLLVINRLENVAAALGKFGSGIRGLRLSAASTDEIGQLESDFNEMAQHIQKEEAENQALSEDLHQQARRQQELLRHILTAQEDERKRVAREIHDELGQSLSGLALHSEALEQFIRSDTERAVQQVLRTREMIDKTTQQMYELILALRPSVLDDLGLVAAVRMLAEKMLSGTGIQLSIDSSGMKGRLPPAIETALYRILQESLSNILRHSGAQNTSISLAQRDGHFEGEVWDDGRGFTPEDINPEAGDGRGLGLMGMQERVTLCGGSMEIISGEGKGTRIRIRIPLEKEGR
jgi:signal transduction histidine kinase